MIPHDRRSSQRQDSGHLVIHADPAESSVNSCLGIAVTLDLNEFGIRVQSADAWTVGERFRFSIAVGEDLIEAIGRVVHVSETLNGTYESGIEFLEISNTSAAKIRARSGSES